MLRLNRSSNPFMSGMRPRKFFQGVSDQVRKLQIIKDKRQYNPNWTKKAA